MDETITYKQNDWIVHRHHGVGRFDGLQSMDIGEEEKTYCKIDTSGSTIWIPEDKMTSEWLRPIASPSEIESAQRVLSSTPEPMSDNLKSRQSTIKNVQAIDSPASIAELLRDLWALKFENKTLPQIEEEALRRFTDCFVTEWSVCMDLPIEQVRTEFNQLIHKGQNRGSSSS